MNIVIIGNGVTGITTARHIRKRSDAKITVISSETAHFYSRTALMYIYMGHMKFEHTKPYEDWFWAKNRIDLIQDKVLKIDAANHQLKLESGQTITYDKLVIASGAKSNKFGWPGQDLKGVQGLYNYQDLISMEENTKNIQAAVIVGGGLIGIEMAEMLHSRHIPVTFLVRESAYWNNILPNEESEMIGRHIRENGMNLRTGVEMKEILSDESGRARAVLTTSGEEIPCQFVGLTAGVSPSIDFIKDSGIETQRGVLVNEYLETNIPHIYAAGDCAQFREPKPFHPPVEQLWYTGKMQAETLAKTLTGIRSAYERGIWYNSAKFIDIEYQTYGFVFNKPRENEQTFYWEHPNGKISFRMVFNDTEATGFNFFGIRYRQVTADSFLREKRDVQYVLQNLAKGFFDPEFYKNHYPAIIAAWNAQYPDKQVKTKNKSGVFASFL